MWSDFFAAALIGLLGAGHCLMMCGGLASALSYNVAPTQVGQSPQPPSRFNTWLSLILYNLGRGLSYCLIGLLFAATTKELSQFFDAKFGLLVLRLLAALMMLMLALYISRLWQGLTIVERAGQKVWRHVQPLAKQFMPLRSPWHALPFGLLWGWLPCGLVYSTLAWAAVSGSAFNGLVIMAGFAVGTFPAMISLGVATQTLKRWLNAVYFRYFAGLLIALFAFHSIYLVFLQI
ncbi:sulfite exporter TauE/SafE family protein [Motilimonas pumila]|uniref:Sulfite exporter TauE/SafE family protein n=1 Tax=Motilimonas pumila TaxID=2303987 RepID=A0A418YB10_9GAMM|nr:sulfite exporter TauE/SafE family protein [Motilimonas pumila]RJG40149.1 sulfite exporter TauE/SafE family protein [Motilimonas pumila]